MKYKTLEEFIELQAELLDLEHNTEVEENQLLYENQSLKHLEDRGICLRHLNVDHHKTGLYGRFLVTFSYSQNKHRGDGEGEVVRTLTHKLSSGDIVGVYPNKGEDVEVLSSGVVSYVRGATITVAFHEDFDVSVYPMYRLMLLTNEVTYRRLKSALEELRKLSSNAPCWGMVERLFPCQPVGTIDSDCWKAIQYFNESLDESQKKAVQFVLQNKQPVSVIHGPPGTGKTTTVVEVVRQAVTHCSLKVLVCAPSNIAVDNLLEKLSGSGLKVLRLGHPARVSRGLQKFSLDAMLTSRDSSDIIKSVRQDISSALGKFKKCKSKADIMALRKEVRELKKELLTREVRAMKEVLMNADVVLSTANSAASDGPLKHLDKNNFGLLIIDEAAQAMEISCWIPMLKVPRLILVGDHKQLPPTIISHKAARKGLEVTLLERVVNGLGENVVSMLTMQYRMHERIMNWPSKELYDNKLVAASSVARHLLCDLDGVEKTADTCVPLIYVDTAGFGMHESAVEDDESKGNEWEVDIIKDHVEALVEAGVTTEQIGIITPYNLQVKMVRKSLSTVYPNLEVHSVDGFQGREKEAILISMVRSNDKGEIGFLSEDRRMNVALTRARRHLFVVGDSHTVSHHPFLRSMCKYFEDECELRAPHNAAYDGSSTAAFQSQEVQENISVKMKSMVDNKPGKGRANCSSHKTFQSKKYNKESMAKAIEQTSQWDNRIDKKTGKADKAAMRENGSESSDVNHASNNKLDVIFRQLEDFTSSPDQELDFPCTLTATERAFVHETAEKLMLNHVSHGEGGNRRIIVSKIIDCKEMDSFKATEKCDKEKKEGHQACEVCSIYVPKANYELHLLRCRKVKEAEKIQVNDKIEKKKTKKKKKTDKDKETKSNDEDIDALLDSFAKSNSRCNFLKCKNPIRTLGQKCEFCAQMFCLTHHMAEIHGCGNLAKIKARQDIGKFKGNMPQKMNDVKKAQLQNKFSSKLAKLEEERKKKVKES